MAGTVVPLLTDVHLCNAIDDWTGTPTLDTEVFIQGTGALSKKVSKTTSTHMKPITAVDLSDTIIYVWILGGSISQFDTKANGGIRIRVQSGATPEWGEWYVAGSDEGYEGGWQCLAIRTTQAFSTQSDPAPDKTQINAVGVVFTVAVSAAKINCWWDAVRYGTGLRIKAGTEGEPATFADIVTAEETVANRWGIVVKTEGILFVQGELRFGSTTAGEATYFKDTSKVIVFRDRAFGTFYEITIEGNSTSNTKVFFGTEIGGRGISGCIFRSVGTSKFKFTATDANITELGVYGCTFFDADTISLPSYSTVKKVLSTTFEECAEVLADTCIVQYCNFISADSRGARISSIPNPPSGLNITACNFISCPDGVNISVDGTVSIDFNNLKFSGNTKDIEKSSATGDLTVNNTNGSDASTYEITGGGTVTIETAVSLTVRHVKTGSEPTEYVRCSIHKKSDMTEIMNKDATETDEQTSGYYKAVQSYTVSGIVVIVRAREKGYLPFEIELTIPSGGLDVTAVWLPDPNYEP